MNSTCQRGGVRLYLPDRDLPQLWACIGIDKNHLVSQADLLRMFWQ